MKRYLFFLLLNSYMHAADQKQSLTGQIQQCKERMNEALECCQASREALDKTIYMNAYLREKEMLAFYEQDLRDALAKQQKAQKAQQKRNRKRGLCK